MQHSNPDPLLQGLAFLTNFYNLSGHSTGAIHGLPVNAQLTPKLFQRAAERCGLTSRVVERRLDRFHAATLPVVLLLEDNDAVILLRYGRGKSAEVSVLSAGGGVQKVKLKDLERSYTGHAILVAPTYEFDASSDFVPPPPKRNWFWGTLLRFSGFYARVGCATIMINLLALTSSLFIMNVYDRVVPNQAIDTLFALAAGAVAAFLLEFALKSLRTFFVDRAGHRIDLILGGDLFAQVMGMRFDAKPPSSGALAGQARSYEGLREFFTSATVAALVDLPFIFVFAGIVFLLGGPVAIPLIAGAVLSLTIAGLVQIPMSQAVRKGYLAGNQRQGLFVEGVNAMETVKATRSESELQARMEASVHIGSKADGQARGLAQFALNSNGLIQHLVTVGMVVMAFYQIRAEQMSMGAMIACVILAGRAMAPLMIVSSLLARLQQSRRALKGLNEIMKAPSERAGKEGQYIRLEKFEPRVRFRDLDFGHHPDSGLVLKQLGFDVEPGERVALLGRVGAGKSTLLRLLMGFYQATGGRIDVSGVEIQQLDPAKLRGWMGYVPQEPTLLLGSLRSNIKAGCPQASDSAVWQAVERAGLADFVRSLPRGLDHPVAEGGKSLSGGQRQAVALARAFLEEPPLLVLDEPTSAMDWNSEQALLERLDSYLAEDKTRTLIVATHKRSVLSIVERAIVIDNGSVVADGPKDRVMSPGVRVRNTPATKIHAVRSEPDGEVALPSIDSPDFESY